MIKIDPYKEERNRLKESLAKWCENKEISQRKLAASIGMTAQAFNSFINIGNPQKSTIEKLILQGVPLNVLFSEEIVRKIQENEGYRITPENLGHSIAQFIKQEIHSLR